MEAPHRPPVTDSPWFWVMIFALMSLGALAAISGKYGRRQAAIERQYQARLRLAEKRAATNNSIAAARHEDQRAEGNPRAFATPANTLITLWPLAAVLVGLALFSFVMLVRRWRQTHSPDAEP
jgi:hypothetical protein